MLGAEVPWRFYNMLVAGQAYRVMPKLLFGTDFPFATTNESIESLRNANQVAAPSMPQISSSAIKEILARDAFALLGIADVAIV